MTWFHVILGIYAVMTLGPLLIALSIECPAAEDLTPHPAPRAIPSHSTQQLAESK